MSKKLAHTRLPRVGFRSWSRFLAVSLQVTWVVNPAVGCHYFPPGLQLPPGTLKKAATNFTAWWTQWVWTVCLRLLADSVTTATWTQAFCDWVQHANHSATEPPTLSRPIAHNNQESLCTVSGIVRVVRGIWLFYRVCCCWYYDKSTVAQLLAVNLEDTVSAATFGLVFGSRWAGLVTATWQPSHAGAADGVRIRHSRV